MLVVLLWPLGYYCCCKFCCVCYLGCSYYSVGRNQPLITRLKLRKSEKSYYYTIYLDMYFKTDVSIRVTNHFNSMWCYPVNSSNSDVLNKNYNNQVQVQWVDFTNSHLHIDGSLKKFLGLCSNCQERKNDAASCFVVVHLLSEKQWNEKHPQLFMTTACHS